MSSENPPDEFDYSRQSTYDDDLRVSEDGYYTCVPCDTVVEATGEAIITDENRTRGLWICPECGETYVQ